MYSQINLKDNIIQGGIIDFNFVIPQTTNIFELESDVNVKCCEIISNEENLFGWSKLNQQFSSPKIFEVDSIKFWTAEKSSACFAFIFDEFKYESSILTLFNIYKFLNFLDQSVVYSENRNVYILLLSETIGDISKSKMQNAIEDYCRYTFLKMMMQPEIKKKADNLNSEEKNKYYQMLSAMFILLNGFPHIINTSENIKVNIYLKLIRFAIPSYSFLLYHSLKADMNLSIIKDKLFKQVGQKTENTLESENHKLDILSSKIDEMKLELVETKTDIKNELNTLKQIIVDLINLKK